MRPAKKFCLALGILLTGFTVTAQELLNNGINSRYPEVKLFMSKDGTMMFFTRVHHPKNIGGIMDTGDIWFSEIDENGNWKSAQRIAGKLNNKGENYVTSFKVRKNKPTLVLHGTYHKNIDPGLSKSEHDRLRWTDPTPIPVKGEALTDPANEFYLSYDRKVFIVSKESPGMGKDLYVSFFREGQLTAPVPLTGEINSYGNETDVFLSYDNRRMYFASDRQGGYGGYDIYVSERLDDSFMNWSAPVNLGTSVNTTADERSIQIPEEGGYSYFVREEKGDSNIYRLQNSGELKIQLASREDD